MSYKKGDITVGEVVDYRTQDCDMVFAAYLPHSCEGWVIGQAHEIDDLIDDLQEVRRQYWGEGKVAQ